MQGICTYLIVVSNSSVNLLIYTGDQQNAKHFINMRLKLKCNEIVFKGYRFEIGRKICIYRYPLTLRSRGFFRILRFFIDR